jgi:hypothetical protein
MDHRTTDDGGERFEVAARGSLAGGGRGRAATRKLAVSQTLTAKPPSGSAAALASASARNSP